MSTIVLQPTRAPRSVSGTDNAGLVQRLWSALEAHGQRRAAQELRRVAARHAYGDPVMASRLLAAAEAADASSAATTPYTAQV